MAASGHLPFILCSKPVGSPQLQPAMPQAHMQYKTRLTRGTAPLASLRYLPALSKGALEPHKPLAQLHGGRLVSLSSSAHALQLSYGIIHLPLQIVR